MKIYISGKISGLSIWEYHTKFGKAENDLMSRGYSVINPAMVQSVMPKDTTYEEYMQMSMLELSFCDTIYMLDNWKQSEGAKKELKYAIEHGCTLMFEGEAPCRSIS